MPVLVVDFLFQNQYFLNVLEIWRHGTDSPIDPATSNQIRPSLWCIKRANLSHDVDMNCWDGLQTHLTTDAGPVIFFHCPQHERSYLGRKTHPREKITTRARDFHNYQSSSFHERYGQKTEWTLNYE